jgi:uncharacterized protein DUF983
MQDTCSSCGVRFEREPGFFLGSIYINYGLTTLIVAIAYPVLRFHYLIDKAPLLAGSLLFAVVFPILIFPWTRSLWMGFDQWRDPREGETGTSGARG